MQWWSSRSWPSPQSPNTADVNQHPGSNFLGCNRTLHMSRHPAGSGISSHRSIADPCTGLDDRRAASCVGGPVAAFPVAGPCLKRKAKAQKPRYGPAVPATCQRRSEVPAAMLGFRRFRQVYKAQSVPHFQPLAGTSVDHAGVALKQDLPGNPLGPQLPHVKLRLVNLDGRGISPTADADRDVDAGVNRKDPIVPQACTPKPRGGPQTGTANPGRAAATSNGRMRTRFGE